MTEREAIERANEFARARGRDTKGYEASAERDGGEWRVDFRPADEDVKSAPGDFFTVYVNNRTGEARMFEGK